MTFKRRLIVSFLFSIMLLGTLVSLPSPAAADELNEIRIRAGLDFFPTVLAADTRINEKRDSNGGFSILIVYKTNKRLARNMADYIEQQLSGYGKPSTLTICSYDALSDFEHTQISGLYLVQQSDRDISKAIDFGIQKQVIVFSPFNGDVERGATAGFIITDTIKPYVNIKTMTSTSLTLKPFFLKVAERYER